MKYFAFLMLAVCVGCSGQQPNVKAGPYMQYGCGTGGACTPAAPDSGYSAIAPGALNWSQPDRFANCVTSNGIHYCPEGRYVQISEDVKPYGSFVCPPYQACITTAPPVLGSSGIDPKKEYNPADGGDNGFHINPQIKDDNSHLDLNSCPVNASGSFNCPPASPTTKKAQRAPSCSLWLLQGTSDVVDLMYCGDHKATLDELVVAPFIDGPLAHREGDKDIPNHKETKPSVREFYPPDPDKGPQILKASLRIQYSMSFKSIQNKISKSEGVGSKEAGAILASATRNASPEAKRKNPALKKVKMASGGSIRNAAANEAGPWMKGGC